MDSLERMHALRADLMKAGIEVVIVDFKYPDLVIKANDVSMCLFWRDDYWSYNDSAGHDDTVSAIVGACNAGGGSE